MARLDQKWTRSPVLRTISGMVGGNLLAAVFACIGSIVQVRYVGPEDLGYFRQFGILTGYAFFLHLGVFDALQRLYPLYSGQGRRKEALGVAEICQSWSVVVSMLMVTVFGLLAVQAFVAGNARGGLAWLAQAAAGTAFTYTTYLSTTYRSGHDFVTVVKGTVLGSIANLATLPFFLLWPYLAMVLRSCIGSLTGLLYLHRRRPLRLSWRLDWRELYAVVRRGLPLFTAWYGTITGWTATEAALVVKLLGTVPLGLWTAGRMLLEMANKPCQAITAVYLPRIIEEYGRTGSTLSCLRLCRRPMLWGVAVGVTIAIGCWLGLQFIVPVLMPKYTAAIPIMSLMMLHLPLTTLEMPYHVVIAKGHGLLMNVFSYSGLACFTCLAFLTVHLGLGLSWIVASSLLGRCLRLGMIYLVIAAYARREQLSENNVASVPALDEPKELHAQW